MHLSRGYVIRTFSSSQIEAADKQLKATRQFLEDQAAEREQERDEFSKEIDKLRILVKEKDKDKTSQESLVKEVRDTFMSLMYHQARGIFLTAQFYFICSLPIPNFALFFPLLFPFALKKKLCMLIIKKFDVGVVIDYVSSIDRSINAQVSPGISSPDRQPGAAN